MMTSRNDFLIKKLLMHLRFVFLLPCFVSSQRFGKMREASLTGEHVTLAVEVDPQSSTFAFNWFARVNGSTTTNINLALVGLDGNGTVGISLQSNTFSGRYKISNDPMNLATTTSPWNTSLTFNFFDKVSTFRFLVSTVVLEELSPSSYSGSTAGSKALCVNNGGVLILLMVMFSHACMPLF